MKRIYYFLVNSGKVLFIWMILSVLSVSLYSFTIKGKVNYGDRCYQFFDQTCIKNYQYEGVELQSSNLECNTYYLSYKSVLEEKENLVFLASLSKLLSDNKINVDVHIIIKCDNYQILSTIVDYQISYVKSLI